MNKVNWRLTRTPRVRAEESKGTNEPECEQKKLRFKRNSKRTEVRTVLFKRCIRVVAHSIPIWHDIMLSVGRSFRSNYSTSSFSSNFPRADSIHSNLKFILHSLHHPPTTLFLTRNAMFCIPCLHLPMWWRWFSTISSIWKGAKPFKATLPCRTHTYKHKLAQKESERERERERDLCTKYLAFHFPFFASIHIYAQKRMI